MFNRFSSNKKLTFNTFNWALKINVQNVCTIRYRFCFCHKGLKYLKQKKIEFYARIVFLTDIF